MKKVLVSMFVCFAVCLGLVACANKAVLPAEIVGRYELSFASGIIGGVSITEDSYEYFELIFEKNGTATVRSKASGIGASEYEAKGTAVYEDGKIKLTTTNGSSSVTEEYTYNDGVINYRVLEEGIIFTLSFTKAE